MKKILIFSSLLICNSLFGQITTIYQENFTGSNLNQLNGTLTDIGNGAWIAGSGWSETGRASVLNNNFNNAFLPITIESDKIYTLSMSVSALKTPTTENWTGFGFTSTNVVTTQFFNNASRPWSMWGLLRADGELMFFNGSDNPKVNLTPQTIVPVFITLDTTSPVWNYSFGYNDGTSLITLGSGSLASNPTINYVGFGQYLIDSNIASFSLTSQVPEPSTYAMLGFSALLMLWIVRRNRLTSSLSC